MATGTIHNDLDVSTVDLTLESGITATGSPVLRLFKSGRTVILRASVDITSALVSGYNTIATIPAEYLPRYITTGTGQISLSVTGIPMCQILANSADATAAPTKLRISPNVADSSSSTKSFRGQLVWFV